MKENPEGKDPSMNTQKNSGRVQVKGVGVPMAILATNLGNQLGHIVVDKTGLAGAWDFQRARDIAQRTLCETRLRLCGAVGLR